MKTGVKEPIASLKINDLLIFVELSQVKSVREIARRRKVDPATISRTLSRIESAVGRPLFARTADGIITNEAGRQLINNCRQLTSFLDGVTADPETQEIFSFGSNSFLSTHFLGNSVDEIMQLTKSQCQIRLLDFPPNELIAAGLKGAFQMAVYFDPLPWPEATWTTVPLGQISWGLYCRKGHPLVSKSKLQVKDILKHPFIFPIYWGATEAALGDDQLPIPLFRRKKTVGTATAETAFVALQNSNLLAYLPSLIVQEKTSSGDVVELKTPLEEVRRTLYLTVKSDTLTANRFRGIIKILRARIESQFLT